MKTRQQLAPGIYRLVDAPEPATVDVPVSLGAPGVFRLLRQPMPPPAEPLAAHAVCPRRLARSGDGTHYNASLLRHGGRLLLAYRTGTSGSNLHVALLNGSFQATQTTPVKVAHRQCAAGREDPRLFAHRGRLHLAFVGVEFIGKDRIRTSMLLARLRDDFSVEEMWAPEYGRRATWEKNWSFFSHEDELYCVYSVQPHVILHCHGHDAFPFCETQTRLPWSGGLLRGGASPVRVGDEYWHWFHGRLQKDGLIVYNAGVVTFEARPPFRPRRITPRPLLTPEHAIAQRTAGDWKDVVFVCGAALEDGRWLVSAGVHDREIEVYEFDHQAVEKAMVRV